jgi:hypothetical protein
MTEFFKAKKLEGAYSLGDLGLDLFIVKDIY